MPVNIDLQPPPQFDRSLLGYATINFNRIRNAFGQALGGDYRTGTFTVTFTASAYAAGTVFYSPQFATALEGACVVLTPILDLGTAVDLGSRVARADEIGFVWVFEALSGPVTLTFKARWVAFFP